MLDDMRKAIDYRKDVLDALRQFGYSEETIKGVEALADKVVREGLWGG